MFIVPRIMILWIVFPCIAFLIIWELVWKCFALYKAGANREIWRFICLFLFNTCWILPIVYLIITKNKDNKNTQTHQKQNIENKKRNEK